MNALAELRRQSPEYQRFKILRIKINAYTRKLNKEGLSERAGYHYYVMLDEMKELKRVLRKKGLID